MLRFLLGGTIERKWRWRPGEAGFSLSRLSSSAMGFDVLLKSKVQDSWSSGTRKKINGPIYRIEWRKTITKVGGLLLFESDLMGVGDLLKNSLLVEVAIAWISEVGWNRDENGLQGRNVTVLVFSWNSATLQ